MSPSPGPVPGGRCYQGTWRCYCVGWTQITPITQQWIGWDPCALGPFQRKIFGWLPNPDRGECCNREPLRQGPQGEHWGVQINHQFAVVNGLSHWRKNRLVTNGLNCQSTNWLVASVRLPFPDTIIGLVDNEMVLSRKISHCRFRNHLVPITIIEHIQKYVNILISVHNYKVI